MHAKPRLQSLFVASLVGLVASCSLVTGWDGLGSGAGGSGGGAGTRGSGGGSGASGGASTTSGGGGGGDASVDAPEDAPDATRCMEGGFYCGGDKVMGDPNTLYKCGADGSATVFEVCQYGCTIRPPGDDDTCRCQPGGFYCGGDKLVGDPDTLYKCKTDGTGSVVMHCANGCLVVSGDDDRCKP